MEVYFQPLSASACLTRKNHKTSHRTDAANPAKPPGSTHHGLVLWFFRVRHALAERGWKYTSIALVLLPVQWLPGSVYVVLRELTIIQPGSTVDTALSYAIAALGWITLGTMVAGVMLDAWRRTRQSAAPGLHSDEAYRDRGR